MKPILTPPPSPRRRRLLAAALGLGAVHRASAHGSAAHATAPRSAAAEQQAWGIAGEDRLARRTVAFTMGDDMRFHPPHFDARLGETLRLRLHNRGRLMHEFVLGTRETLDEHAALMLKFPDMEHGEAWMAHVPPGRRAEIVWTFNRPGDFEFACLIAGHHQAGMRGTIRVTDTSRRGA